MHRHIKPLEVNDRNNHADKRQPVRRQKNCEWKRCVHLGLGDSMWRVCYWGGLAESAGHIIEGGESMNKNHGVSSSSNDSSSETGINRREMVRRLMMVGGAGLALPGISEGYQAARPVAKTDTARETGGQAAKTGWTPAFLDLHQSQTLNVLAERIIPGSSRAEVTRFIDLLLSVDTPEAQKKFLASLSAFEADSLRRFSHPYKDLSAGQQNEILASASTKEQGKAQEAQPQPSNMRDHFENIKIWVAEAYYSSVVQPYQSQYFKKPWLQKLLEGGRK